MSSIPRFLINISKYINICSNINPTIIPPIATKTKFAVASNIEKVPVNAAAKANLKDTIPDASFNSPSPSIRCITFLGNDIFFESALTAT
ncbi:hypothetical protein CNEONATNEC26_02270 [Clostridium neonatale]|nr:hypothetical protein CNEONATNEC26_02270 [Clostridium neonatale]